MTGLLSEMSTCCVKAVCQIRSASYGSKQASPCLSDKPFVPIYLHNLKTAGDVNVLHIEQLLCYRRQSLYGFELHEKLDWRVTSPDMHRSFSDKILLAYTAGLYTCISLFGVQIYSWQQNSRASCLHATHQTTALLPKTCIFIRTRLATFRTSFSVFSVIVYANIRITNMNYHTCTSWLHPAAKNNIS